MSYLIPNTVFELTYMGHVIDEADTRAEAERLRDEMVELIFTDEVPDFLTGDDFDNRTDCRRQLVIRERNEG